MLFPKARMIVSLCLFLGWIGFLFYLVLESPQTIVPWRQFETAHFYVVADIRENQGKLDPQVTIEEILWPPPPADQFLPKTVQLPELAAYDEQPAAELARYKKQLGFQGAGKYILPLMIVAHRGKKFKIAPIPRVFGYPHPPSNLWNLFLYKVKENPEAFTPLVARTVGLLASPLGGPLPAASVVFPEKEAQLQKVIQTLMDETGRKQKEVAILLTPLLEHRSPAVEVAHRVPERQALELKKKLEDAGARIELEGEEVAIYPLLPETRAQVKRFIESKQRPAGSRQ